MPELSRFYGIVIRMHFDDHLPIFMPNTANMRPSSISIHWLSWPENCRPGL
jgi:hypothetical protein